MLGTMDSKRSLRTYLGNAALKLRDGGLDETLLELGDLPNRFDGLDTVWLH
jgi:hypothetical protein